MKNRITLAILAAALLAWSGTASAQYSFPQPTTPAALNNGATIGETLGPELLTQTCAGWGLTTPVGATSCSGDTITRTASGSNLTITNAAAIPTAGTEYKFVTTYATITAGSATSTIGAVTGGSIGVAAVQTQYLPAGTAGVATITFSATFAGTITVSGTSVKAVASEVVPVGGPVIVNKDMTRTTGHEVGLQVTAHVNGTLSGDKVAQRTDLDGGSSTTGRRLLYQAAADGTEVYTLASSGGVRHLGGEWFQPPSTSILTGSIDPAASTTLTGVGTFFLRELMVGDKITVSGETRTVTAIASDTSLTVDTATTDTANDTSVDRYPVGLAITGADSSVGTDIFVNPAVKSSGNLMDLRVGGTSKFSVGFGGATTAVGQIVGPSFSSSDWPGTSGTYRQGAALGPGRSDTIFKSSPTLGAFDGSDTFISFDATPAGSPTHTGTGNSIVGFNAGNITAMTAGTGLAYGVKIGTGYDVPIVAVPPAAQTISAGNTISVLGACGTMKQITAAGAVTTDTTNTFTAPAAGNAGCCFDLVNVGAQNITLDNNALFFSPGAADVVMTANDAIRICGNGSAWYAVSALVAN